NELQEAISAHAAREETAEYSDDFESDEDGMLHGIGEELNESNSGAESSKKPVAVESLLSGDDDDASQKAADLENEAANDLTLSFHKKKVQQVMLLESGNIQEDRKDEEECLKSQNEGDDRKNNGECSAPEEGNSESDHCNDLPVCELQKKRNQEETKPIPKPRVHKGRNASASGEKKAFASLFKFWGFFHVCESLTVLRGCEEPLGTIKSVSVSAISTGFTFVSHPFRTGYKISMDPELKSTRIKLDIYFNFLRESYWGLICCISPNDLKQENNSRKTPSVTEAMMTTVDEKTNKLEKSADDCSDEIVKIREGQIVTGTMQQVSVNDQSEHVEENNTSKDSVKITNMSVSWYLYRSLSPACLKKKMKAVPSAARISSQYLGTLKVLEDKPMQSNSTEFDKADSLRAAVFQNWLEKKRVLLLEIKRTERKKAENLRNDAEKKEAVKREEAIASFEAWKKKKGREAKKLREIKKVEELRKKKAAEENVQKTEAAQKAFEKWKERKAEYLTEQSKKEKQSERIRKKKEEELAAEKKRDSMSAVEKWNEKKKKYMKQKKVEKILERRKQEIQQAEKEEKDKKAMEEYKRWLEKKEKREQLEKKQKKLQAVRGDEASLPWSPPGKVTYSMNY
ncbi:MAP9 protein, partial [Rostratula benghalensis]|nr:MAP9 protein [Rostratula benghalensis]